MRTMVLLGCVACTLALALTVGCSGPERWGAGASAPAQSDEEPRFESLRTIITERGPRSVEEVVTLLPASLRSRFVLMHDSRSLQEASYHAPRAILYSHDASFILTFNGEPEQRGYRSLETMEYEDERGAFVFRDISFAPDAGKERGPVVSEVNPARCRSCHGDDPRPIWDTYPVWPGAYGEVEGQRDGAEATAGLSAFLSERASSPRYRALVGAESLSERVAFSPTGAYDGRRVSSRNADFGARLQRLVYRAIARQVVTAPRFGAFRYALLASLDRQCLDLESFVPDPLKRRFARSAASFDGETERANAEQAAAKAARSAAPPDSTATPPAETLSAFRFLVEEGLHLSTRRWTLALEKGTYDFTTGRPSTSELERAILDQVARTDPWARELRAAPDRRDTYCSTLRKKSLAALSE